MRFTRREFTVAGASMLLSTAPIAKGLLVESPVEEAPGQNLTLPWYRTVKRVGQINFNEEDGKSLRVEEWANFWADAKVQAVALSVSGPVAFYPSAVPFFHHSVFLNGRDLFGECVRAAKKRELRVYARMSPDIQWMDPDLIKAHPLWFRRHPDGSIQSSAPHIGWTCVFSEHFSQQQPAIMRELNARYDIDGVYMNGWPLMQTCYCDTCRKIGDPHSDGYRTAVMNRVDEMIHLYKSIVLEKSPNNFYSCNLGGGLKESSLDQWRLTRDALWYSADNQVRSAVVAPVWQDASQVKFARALMGDRTVASITAAYTRAGRVAWRQVSDTSWEPMCRMAQTAAAGGTVWYHWLGLEQAFGQDLRWQQHGRDFMQWHAKNDAHFHNKRSLAKLAVVASSRSVTMYKAPYKEDLTDHFEGMYAALVEARIPFDLIHEEDLNSERLSQYSVLVLPNVALLSDAQVQALTGFASKGGSLLATFQTGLFDEHGTPRSDFAIKDLFGVAKAGEPVRSEPDPTDPMEAIHLQHLIKRGPLTEGFEQTSWIAGPVWRQPVVATGDVPMSFIKPYPVYPPEAVFQRELPSDIPAMVTREAGRSRFVYLAGDVDSSYWRLDHPDLSLQLGNAVRWLLRDSSVVEVKGEGLVEVIGWETQAGDYAVHLLNYTGANAYRGHMRKPATLSAQTVHVTVPNGIKMRSAKLLSSGVITPFQQKGNAVKLTVPSLGYYEIVLLSV